MRSTKKGWKARREAVGERPSPVSLDRQRAPAFHSVMVSGTITPTSATPEELARMAMCRTKSKQLNTGMPHFLALCFIVLYRYCVFFLNKLKVCGNPASSKPIGVIFLTAFARLISLCHILVILSIFQTFKLLLYLLQ